MKRFGLLLIICSLFLVAGCGSDEKEPISTIPYEVAKSEDVGAKRLKIFVVVEEQATKEQLQKLSDQIFEDQKKSTDPFTALFILFYDHPGYIGYYMPPLGQSEYFPNGDRNQVHKITPGNYQNFKGAYDLKEKDWSTQPTPEEADINLRFSKFLFDPQNDDHDEDDVIADFLKQTNIDPIEFAKINHKALVWTGF
jgi:hypothetical protein